MNGTTANPQQFAFIL